MKSVKQLVSTAIMNKAYQYMAKDPMKNLPKLIDWAEKIMKVDYYQNTLQMFRDIAKDPANNWNQLIQRYFNELNQTTQKKFLIDFTVNAGIVGQSVIEKSKRKYDCNVPWAILFDPTAACNLHCTGCWAAEYGKGVLLDYATMQKIIQQGKELGVYMYILSGGEPTVRKDEILRLAEENDDCMFLSFTNATLIDETFAAEIERLGNFAFAVSVEGYEDETDMRRGKGTYLKVMDAMDILQRHGIIFGFSTCYHRKNTEIVGSEEWVDAMIAKGYNSAGISHTYRLARMPYRSCLRHRNSGNICIIRCENTELPSPASFSISGMTVNMSKGALQAAVITYISILMGTWNHVLSFTIQM